MANFALNYSYSRNKGIPLDEDAVKSTLSEVKEYVKTKSKCYAGQLFSVTGDTANNGLYITLSVGPEGGVLKLATQEALDAVAESAGKIDTIKLNGSALTINNKTVEINLKDYATVSYVENVISGLTNVYAPKAEFEAVKDQVNGFFEAGGGEPNVQSDWNVESPDSDAFIKNKPDLSIYATTEQVNNIESNMYWLPVDGVDNKVIRHWRGGRDSYEFLVKNSAVTPWTKYVVIDIINGEERLAEYYGTNQVLEHTGQLLPVNSIIENISEIEPEPYDRYLVGKDGEGYEIYEYVIDTEKTHRWIVKPFDYRYGVRVKSEGLKNYIYFDNKLFTYDEFNGGEF